MSDPNPEFQPPPPPAIEAEPARPRPMNLMWAGIALIVIGIIIVALGIPGIALIIGGIGTRAAVGALGGLLLAFTFIRPPAGKRPPATRSTPAAIAAIFPLTTSRLRR